MSRPRRPVAKIPAPEALPALFQVQARARAQIRVLERILRAALILRKAQILRGLIRAPAQILQREPIPGRVRLPGWCSLEVSVLVA
jgi:hypothetical protein